MLDSPERLLAEDYDRALVGMIRGEVPPLVALLECRAQLRRDIVAGISESDRAFLIGFFAGEPDWLLLPYPHASQLPALTWKLRNLEIFRSKRPDEFDRQHAALVALLT